MVDGACARGVARCSSWWYGNEMLCGCKKREHCGGHKKKGNKCKVIKQWKQRGEIKTNIYGNIIGIQVKQWGAKGEIKWLKKKKEKNEKKCLNKKRTLK